MQRGNKCSFFNCGKCKRNDSSLHLYKFPTDPERQRAWLNNSGEYQYLRVYILLLNSKVKTRRKYF